MFTSFERFVSELFLLLYIFITVVHICYYCSPYLSPHLYMYPICKVACCVERSCFDKHAFHCCHLTCPEDREDPILSPPRSLSTGIHVPTTHNPNNCSLNAGTTTPFCRTLQPWTPFDPPFMSHFDQAQLPTWVPRLTKHPRVRSRRRWFLRRVGVTLCPLNTTTSPWVLWCTWVSHPMYVKCVLLYMLVVLVV